MGPFGGHLDYILYYRPPLWGGPPGVPFLAPRGAPPPRGAKKCTFFWVFNNSPSRDSLGHFFHPPILGQFGTVWDYADLDSVYSMH